MLLVTSELNNRYDRTYVLCNGEIVEPQEFRDDGKDTLIALVRPLGAAGTKTICLDNEGLTLRPPQLGLVNVDDAVVYVQRYAERQYRRGLNMRVLNSICPVDAEMRALGMRSVTIADKKLVKALFFPKHVSADLALASVSKGRKLAVAFNRKYGFGVQRGHKDPFLIYKSVAVAPVRDGVVRLPRATHHLYEEVSQYVQTVKD